MNIVAFYQNDASLGLSKAAVPPVINVGFMWHNDTAVTSAK